MLDDIKVNTINSGGILVLVVEEQGLARFFPAPPLRCQTYPLWCQRGCRHFSAVVRLRNKCEGEKIVNIPL